MDVGVSGGGRGSGGRGGGRMGRGFTREERRREGTNERGAAGADKDDVKHGRIEWATRRCCRLNWRLRRAVHPLKGG